MLIICQGPRVLSNQQLTCLNQSKPLPTTVMPCRYLNSLTIICFPPGTDLCTRAVDLFGTLATPENGLADQVCNSICSALHSHQDSLTTSTHHAVQVHASQHRLHVLSAHANKATKQKLSTCCTAITQQSLKHLATATCCCPCLQRQQAVMSSSAVNQVLASIPGLPLQEHQADSLRMMGSLQMLASSSMEDILDNTDLGQSQ